MDQRNNQVSYTNAPKTNQGRRDTKYLGNSGDTK